MKPTCARRAGSPDPRRDKAVDNGGLQYGAVESAFRPPLPTATRALAEIQIQASLDQRLRAKHHPIDPRRRRVADIKSESRPASNRNRCPASYWNAWPASSETAPQTYMLLESWADSSGCPGASEAQHVVVALERLLSLVAEQSQAVRLTKL
jgi:hypothetical protein